MSGPGFEVEALSPGSSRRTNDDRVPLVESESLRNQSPTRGTGNVTVKPKVRAKPWLLLVLLEDDLAGPAMANKRLLSGNSNPGEKHGDSGKSDAEPTAGGHQTHQSEDEQNHDGGSHPCPAQQNALGAVFANLGSLGFCFFLPAGILFDRTGGKFTGTLGAAVALVGYLLLYWVVAGANADGDGNISVDSSSGSSSGRSYSGFDQNWNRILLPIAIIFTDAGAALNSYSLFAIIYEFPGNTALIIALSNSSYGAAAFMPALMNWFIDRLEDSDSLQQYYNYGFGGGNGDGNLKPSNLTGSGRLQFGIICISILAFISLFVCYFCTPDREQYRQSALRVTGLPVPQTPTKIKKNVAICLGIFAENPRDHLEFMLYGASMYAYAQVLLSYLSPFAKTLLGSSEEATGLSEFAAESNGWVAITFGPLSGVFIDEFGITLMVRITVLSMVLSTVLLPIASYEVLQAAISFGVRGKAE